MNLILLLGLKTDVYFNQLMHVCQRPLSWYILHTFVCKGSSQMTIFFWIEYLGFVLVVSVLFVDLRMCISIFEKL